MGKKASQPAPKAPAIGGWKGKIYDYAAKFEAIANRVAAPKHRPCRRLRRLLETQGASSASRLQRLSI